MKMSKPRHTGVENYQYRRQLWKRQQVSSFKDSMCWYNNKDVPTLDAMPKMIAFYRDKDIDLLELRCTLRNPANICLQIYKYKVLSLHKGIYRSVRENSRRCCWWSFYRFHTQSS